MSNFFTRTLTGVLFVALIVSSIVLSHYFFCIVFLIITILSILEYYTLIQSDKVSPAKVIGVSLGIILFLSFFLAATEIIQYKYLFLNIPLILLVFITELFRKTENSISNISYTISGVFYIALPMAILNFFYNPSLTIGASNYSVLLGFFILVWLHDVGAYLLGSAIGRHKLFERISPKKTWEGTLGGTIMCVAAASFLPELLGGLSTFNWIIVALIIILFGTLGDLTESMIKRNMNVKDSGKLLPGHGGMLDRFDAVLFASPVVFAYLLLIS